MRKRFLNPYLLMNQSTEDTGGGKPNAGNGGENTGGEGGKTSTGFPADTAVKDMTPDEQAAYWKHQARKHETRVKAYGDLTPEQAQKLADEREEARKKSLPDADRIKEEARTEANTEAAKREAETALKVALRGRSIDGAAAFSRPDFVKDGVADVDAILDWVEQNSQPSNGGGGGSNKIPGQGHRERIQTTGRATGRAEAERRFGKKS